MTGRRVDDPSSTSAFDQPESHDDPLIDDQFIELLHEVGDEAARADGLHAPINSAHEGCSITDLVAFAKSNGMPVRAIYLTWRLTEQMPWFCWINSSCGWSATGTGMTEAEAVDNADTDLKRILTVINREP